MAEQTRTTLSGEDEVDVVMESVLEAAGLSTTDPYGSDDLEESEPPVPTEPEVAEPTPPAAPPSLEEDLAALDEIERHVFAHRYVTAELETFGETIDPPKATPERAEVLAVLTEEQHARLANPQVGALLDRLTEREGELEPMRAAQVRVLSRDRHELVSVPATLRSRLVRLQAESYDVWVKAKRDNDWRSFAPYLDRLVNMQRKVALAINPAQDPYDTLLDLFEPGANRAVYNSFFARVKQAIVPLMSSIQMCGRTLSRTCVEGRFDEGRQWLLAKDICEIMGIDPDAHFLTTTEHPFSQGMSPAYVVTAAHVVTDDVVSNVYTMLHELGHNLYEQGVDPSLTRTSLAGGTSMGMHEGQSRLFENYVGRDRAFMGPLLALMRNRFPGQLGRVTPNQLYAAVNRVVPSLIRTEADELTYPLHVLVRYEIEQLLLAGSATAREVPYLWAERYRKYIGAEVPSDTLGALQDVHWAEGLFGYFPTYALGGAFAAQLRAKMIDEGMDWQGLLEAGDLSPIRAWLTERVWCHGRAKNSEEIIEYACGEPFDPGYYTEYLSAKFSALYGLR